MHCKWLLNQKRQRWCTAVAYTGRHLRTHQGEVPDFDQCLEKYRQNNYRSDHFTVSEAPNGLMSILINPFCAGLSRDRRDRHRSKSRDSSSRGDKSVTIQAPGEPLLDAESTRGDDRVGHAASLSSIWSHSPRTNPQATSVCIVHSPVASSHRHSVQQSSINLRAIEEQCSHCVITLNTGLCVIPETIWHGQRHQSRNIAPAPGGPPPDMLVLLFSSYYCFHLSSYSKLLVAQGKKTRVLIRGYSTRVQNSLLDCRS